MFYQQLPCLGLQALRGIRPVPGHVPCPKGQQNHVPLPKILTNSLWMRLPCPKFYQMLLGHIPLAQNVIKFHWDRATGSETWPKIGLNSPGTNLPGQWPNFMTNLVPELMAMPTSCKLILCMNSFLHSAMLFFALDMCTVLPHACSQ